MGFSFRNLHWNQKLAIRKTRLALYVSVWVVLFSLPIYAAINMFPFYGSLGDVVYMFGRLSGLFGLFFLAFVISSRSIFFFLKSVVDPVKFNKALYIIEIHGLTLIFLHPAILVAGRYLMGSPMPFDIIIPNFSNGFYTSIAYGCLAFWALFFAGVAYLLRNSVGLNNKWKYVHLLAYPAFFASVIHGHSIGGSTSYALIDNTYDFLYYAVYLSILFKMTEFLLSKRKEIMRNMRAERTPRKAVRFPSKQSFLYERKQ